MLLFQGQVLRPCRGQEAGEDGETWMDAASRRGGSCCNNGRSPVFLSGPWSDQQASLALQRDMSNMEMGPVRQPLQDQIKLSL